MSRELDYAIATKLGEAQPHPEEETHLDTIIDANEMMLPRGTGDEPRFRPGMRAQHPKAHATVRGSFEVLRDVPDWAQVGLFDMPGSYPAQVRFSNSREYRDNPKKGDAHGLAIRLTGPEGIEGRQFVQAGEARSLDFILMDNETFFEGDLETYAWINDRAGEVIANMRNGTERLGSVLNKISLGFKTKILDRDLNAAVKDASDQFPGSPLTSWYFSTTPYALGDDPVTALAVKYELRPLAVTAPNPEPADPGRSDDYLGRELLSGLKTGPQVFGFYLMRQADPEVHPVEDPTIPWTGAEEALVAKLVLDPVEDTGLSFETWRDAQQAAEGAGYNIWNTLPEHRPLGAINRVRRHVYARLQEIRRSMV